MASPITIPVRLSFDASQASQDLLNTMRGTQASRQDQTTNYQNKDQDQSRLRTLQSILNRDTSNLEGNAKQKAELMQFASEGFKKGAQGLTQITQQSFDVLNTIYKELKKSSPLMEAVESLFQLAMQLFFMPLGNKLGEILIPAVIQLLENVVDMWDELGDGGLGDMLDTAIVKGVSYLADFFNDIGDILIDQGGMTAEIGQLFKGLGNFIENNLVSLLNFIIDWATWNMDHMGILITLIGSFMSLHYALQLGLMSVVAASADSPWGTALGYAAVAVAAGGIALSGYIGSQIEGYAEGGYVPATPGGKVIRVAEGGEGEFIVPESQKEDFDMGGYVPATPGGKVIRVAEGGEGENSLFSKPQEVSNDEYNITNNFYGYTTDELERKVKEVIEDEISRSRLRSGF